METDLHKVIKRKHILQDLHKRYIMYQLLRATYYIHSGNVIHRDQKPSNILLDSYCRCKVADFGLARSLSHPDRVEGVSGTDPALTDYVATRWYRAPEILVASKQYTKGIDMWSLGCILAEMLLGRPLFPGSSTINQVERIMVTMEPPGPGDLACVCPGYGSSLFQRAPAGPRMPLPELLRGAPRDGVDLVCRLLVLNPLKRLTAEQALEHPYVARFRRQGPEPALQRAVVPTLRDDVQLSVHEYRNKLYEMYRGGPVSPSSSSSSSNSSTGSSDSCRKSSKHNRHIQRQPVVVVATPPKPSLRSVASQGGGDAVAAAARSKKTAAMSSGSSGSSGSGGSSATLRAPASPAAKEPSEHRHTRFVSTEDVRTKQQQQQPVQHHHHHLLPKRLSVSDSAVAQGRPPSTHPVRRHNPGQGLVSRRSHHGHLDKLEDRGGQIRSKQPPRRLASEPGPAPPHPQPQLVASPPVLGTAPAPAAGRRSRLAPCPPQPGLKPASHHGQSFNSCTLPLHRQQCRPGPSPGSSCVSLLGAHTVGSVGIISASGLSELRPGYRWRR